MNTKRTGRLVVSVGVVGVGVVGLVACAALGQQDGKPDEPKKDAPPAAQAPAVVPLKKAPDAAPSQPASTPAAQPAAKPKYKQVPMYSMGMFQGNKLPMVQRSVLNNVPGRIDHLGLDLVSNRLFVAAKNNGTLEMLDVETNKQPAAVRGFAEPQGVLVLSDQRKVIVSCGGDNTVHVLSLNDAGDPTPERVVSFEGEADPIRFDAAANRVYVGHGRSLGSFDLGTGERGKSLELSGMPEGFVIDPGSTRIYVNIAQAGTIEVLERDGAELKKVATWTLEGVKGNYAMAMDPASGHLFVAARNPAKLVVVNAKDGRQVAALDCTDDADDCWWDAQQKRIYVSCGGSGGFVEVYQQNAGAGGAAGAAGAPAYSKYHQERTNVGCRTSIWIPEQRRLIVAAPSLGSDPTFLYIYYVGP